MKSSLNTKDIYYVVYISKRAISGLALKLGDGIKECQSCLLPTLSQDSGGSTDLCVLT